MSARLVVVESPYGSRADGTRASPAEVEQNVGYLRRCMADCFARGEAPFASHGLYPGTLDDKDPEQRRQGMEAGFAWGERAELVAVYMDRGITPGMQAGVRRAAQRGQVVEYRSVTLGLVLRCAS